MENAPFFIHAKLGPMNFNKTCKAIILTDSLASFLNFNTKKFDNVVFSATESEKPSLTSKTSHKDYLEGIRLNVKIQR